MAKFIYYPKHKAGRGWQQNPIKIFRGKDGKLHAVQLKAYNRQDRRISRQMDRHYRNYG